MFADASCATSVRAKFLQFAHDFTFAVIAYCLMPDHLHGLLEGLSADSDFRRFVSMFKQRTGFDYRQTTRNHLWQEGYYDHVVRDEESLLGIAAYILHNPERAGLCTTIEDYEFLGSDRYTVAELIDAVQIPPAGWDRASRSATL